MSDMVDDDIIDDDDDDKQDKDKQAKPAQRPPLPLWKKIVLGIALVIGIAGAALYVFEQTQATPPKAEVSAQGLGHSYLSDQTGVPQVGEAGGMLDAITMGDWSTLLMKLGFSFMIGFALGYALSSILKVTLLVIGLVALLLFGLQYAGLIDVNWHNFEPYYDAFITWLHPHIGGFKDFVTSNLPSSASAATGLFIGFRRF